MTEAVLQKKIREHIKNKYRGICIKYHGSIYSQAGVADLLCVIAGRACAFEVKKKDGKVTKLQELFLKEWAEHGAITGVVRSCEDVDALLKKVMHS